jgi:hypothetical protein
MKSRSTLPNPVSIAATIACPCCGGPVARVQKGLIDHLLERFRGVKRRYRCTIVTCGWTTSESVESQPALLRAWSGDAQRDPTGEDSGPRRPGFRR